LLLVAASVSLVFVASAQASSVYLNESAHLRLTSHHGFTLNEEGYAHGAVAGKIFIHLHLVSVNHVTAEVNVYPAGSSVTGLASARYSTEGSFANFNGSMSVVRGSGRYRRAHGTGLRFYGTVQRSNDAVSVHLRGWMYY
jgi:hypothetical protein